MKTACRVASRRSTAARSSGVLEEVAPRAARASQLGQNARQLRTQLMSELSKNQGKRGTATEGAGVLRDQVVEPPSAAWRPRRTTRNGK